VLSHGSSEPVTPEAWQPAWAAEFRAFLDETRAAMNAAREGHWIADTEEVVRDAGERLRQRALERLLQLRVQAGEGAFSPSGPAGGLGGQGAAAGGAPDGGGTRAGSPPRVVEAGRRDPSAGRCVAQRRRAAD
jgi:hypothetical protein